MTQSIEEILRTEFSADFVQHMKNAMALSYYKYGPISEGYPTRVDAVGSLMDRLREYAKTGNTEYLVDVANFAMIEFMHPRHPDAKYEPKDSDQSPGRRSLKNGLVDDRSNALIGTNPASKLAAFR